MDAITKATNREVEMAGHHHEPEPHGAPVSLLLDIDREYRTKARAGMLTMIAPHLFNPCHEAWLPVLHVERDGWSFTALFSNTERAHNLGRTHDWVVLHYMRDGHEKQCTVVTERRGHLAGLRVVRGHEQACRRYYGKAPTPGRLTVGLLVPAVGPRRSSSRTPTNRRPRGRISQER